LAIAASATSERFAFPYAAETLTALNGIGNVDFSFNTSVCLHQKMFVNSFHKKQKHLMQLCKASDC